MCTANGCIGTGPGVTVQPSIIFLDTMAAISFTDNLLGSMASAPSGMSDSGLINCYAHSSTSKGCASRKPTVFLSHSTSLLYQAPANISLQSLKYQHMHEAPALLSCKTCTEGSSSIPPACESFSAAYSFPNRPLTHQEVVPPVVHAKYCSSRCPSRVIGSIIPVAFVVCVPKKPLP